MGELLVSNHLILQAYKDFLHGVLCSPVCKNTELVIIDLSIGLVNRRKIDFGIKADFRGLFGIVRTAFDCEEVDAVIEVSVGRPNDSSIPISEGLILYRSILMRDYN